MGYRTCCGGRTTTESYQVRMPNGTVKRYATAAEAKAAAKSAGGAFEVVRR